MNTIVAQASAAGFSGVGIVRLSGPKSLLIAQKITKCNTFKVRYATYTPFYDNHQHPIDQGLCLYFQAPHSFTGEDVIELQAHGSPIVLDTLIDTAIDYGAVLAKPGEFSQRAFLNQKMDLTQAEAICDLIHSQSIQAAKGAYLSMRGEFSKQMQGFQSSLSYIRALIEADINFSEDIDTLDTQTIQASLQLLQTGIENCLQQSTTSQAIGQGIRVLILGATNTGKSSLFNALIEQDRAIVTNTPGTTRDSLEGSFLFNGLPIYLTDTAGIRETENEIEKIGIQKGLNLIEQADVILLIQDASAPKTFNHPAIPKKTPVISAINKIDLLPTLPTDSNSIYISAKQRIGLESLQQAIVSAVLGEASNTEQAELPFLARKRHISALKQAYQALSEARQTLNDNHPIELVAIHLNDAQQYFATITGEQTHQDLLHTIFSNFCLGK